MHPSHHRARLATLEDLKRFPTREDLKRFATLDDLSIVACSLAYVATSTDGERALGRTEALTKRSPFDAFEKAPRPGNVLLVGLSEAVPPCVVALSWRCTIEGIGVDPRRPPIVWEAWTADDWVPCELESDGTGGLNRDGRIVLHVPSGHAVSLIEGHRAGWLRARVIEPEAGMPSYSASPSIHRLSAARHRGQVGGIFDGLKLCDAPGASGLRRAFRKGGMHVIHGTRLYRMWRTQ